MGTIDWQSYNAPEWTAPSRADHDQSEVPVVLLFHQFDAYPTLWDVSADPNASNPRPFLFSGTRTQYHTKLTYPPGRDGHSVNGHLWRVADTFATRIDSLIESGNGPSELPPRFQPHEGDDIPALMKNTILSYHLHACGALVRWFQAQRTWVGLGDNEVTCEIVHTQADYENTEPATRLRLEDQSADWGAFETYCERFAGHTWGNKERMSVPSSEAYVVDGSIWAVNVPQLIQ